MGNGKLSAGRRLWCVRRSKGFVIPNQQNILSGGRSFHVRKAALDDAEGILNCLNVAFAPYRNQYTAEAFADTVLNAQTVQERLCAMRLFVAVAAGEIVGTISCTQTAKEGHLRGMAVLSEWQGTAVASTLLRVAEGELLANGCDLVTLDTTRPLQRAVRFYEKHGFKPTGRISDFFGMQLFEYGKRLRPTASFE